LVVYVLAQSRGMFSSFMCTTQESKNCNKFGNWANTCSSDVWVKIEKIEKIYCCVSY
jgi:hypothetical protein